MLRIHLNIHLSMTNSSYALSCSCPTLYYITWSENNELENYLCIHFKQMSLTKVCWKPYFLRCPMNMTTIFNVSQNFVASIHLIILDKYNGWNLLKLQLLFLYNSRDLWNFENFISNFYFLCLSKKEDIEHDAWVNIFIILLYPIKHKHSSM